MEAIRFFSRCGYYLKKFDRFNYKDLVNEFYSEYEDLFNDIFASSFGEENKSEDVISELVTSAKTVVEELPKKDKKTKQLDINLIMVVFVMPLIIEKRSEEGKEFTDRLCQAWNKEFDTSIQSGTIDSIQGGFKTKLCYVTTAVCESMGKGSDCDEIRLLKDYRDNILYKEAEGPAMIDSYYDCAPTIVNRIKKLDNSKEVFEDIYKQYINPCIRFIEDKDYSSCKERYTDMVERLRDTYVYKKSN